ncbi:hypothetical protein M3J09_000549 [Ascochyta lentis]
MNPALFSACVNAGLLGPKMRCRIAMRRQHLSSRNIAIHNPSISTHPLKEPCLHLRWYRIKVLAVNKHVRDSIVLAEPEEMDVIESLPSPQTCVTQSRLPESGLPAERVTNVASY